MIGTMRLIPPHGLRNNDDGRFICFILHKRGFEKKKYTCKSSFCKGKITSNNLTKQMISQIFLNKSINRIHKKNLEFLPLFESNEIHIFIHKIVLYQIQRIAQIQAYK